MIEEIEMTGPYREPTLEEHYDFWARAQASRLKNKTLEEFKQRFKPVRLQEGGMVILDAETREEFVIGIITEVERVDQLTADSVTPAD